VSAFPGSPRLLKSGLVLLDPASGAVQRVITMQYNPERLTRTLQAQTIGPDAGDRSQAPRYRGPAVETIKLEAEIDAADQLEVAGPDSPVAKVGLHPQLAALETILYPPSSRLQANAALARAGTLEIIPVESPLVLFVWSQNRIVPVRLTEFSVTEEEFDTSLNPIRAKVSLGMRVLSVNDVDPDSKAGSLYLIYQQQKERLAAQSQSGGFAALGIGGIQ
jgi:hypothetical protein